MTPTEDDVFWNAHAGNLRDLAFLRPLTVEEAEEAAKWAPEVPLNPTEIQRLVAAAVPCEPDVSNDDEEFGWFDNVDTAAVEEGVLQLNRNKGEGDQEAEDAEAELRRRLLDDEEEDEDGMGDGKGSPRRGEPTG